MSDFTFTFHFHALEKAMATHSSTLAWRMPRTEEPGGLPSMGSHRVRHDWSDLAAAAEAHASKVMLQMLQARLQLWTVNFQMFKLGLEKAVEPEIKLPTSAGSSKKQESSRKKSASALLTMPKPLCGSQQTVENSERDGNTRPPDLPPEKTVYRSGSNS